MSCHVEFQAVRTVVTRRPGGRDRPQRSFVTELSREEELLLLLSSSRDIVRRERMRELPVSLRLRKVVVGGMTTRWCEEEGEALNIDISCDI